MNSGDSRKMMPQYFVESDEYLRNEPATKIILNNMGAIWAELGDDSAAAKYFQESIKYTPEDVEYLAPKFGLDNLNM